MRAAPPRIRSLLAGRTVPKLLRFDRPLHFVRSRDIVARLALALRLVRVRRLGIRGRLGRGDGVSGRSLDVEHGVVCSQLGAFAVGVQVEEGGEEGGESGGFCLVHRGRGGFVIGWLGFCWEIIGVRTYNPVTVKAVRAL